VSGGFVKSPRDLIGRSRRGSPRRERPKRTLFLGVDFGTSYTKICYRDPAASLTRAVPLDGEHEYIVPSVLHVGPEGQFSLEAVPESTPVRYLKMVLAGEQVEESGLEALRDRHGARLPRRDTDIAEGLSAVLVGLLLSRGLEWLQTKEPSAVWIVSIGVPVVVADSQERNRFHRVVSRAWSWAQAGQVPQTLEELQHVHGTTAPDESCLVRPEIEAIYQPMLRLRSARPDVYILIDIGGGSVECVASQWAELEERDQVNALCAGAANVGVGLLASMLPADRPILERERSIVEAKSAVRDVARSFGGRAMRRRFAALVGTTVTKGKDRGGLRWEDRTLGALTVFLVGGGHSSPVYRDWLKRVYESQLRQIGIRPFESGGLPAPKDMDTSGIPAPDFHRFAVAYGLSIPPESFTYLPPRAFAANEGWREGRTRDSDTHRICPRCNGRGWDCFYCDGSGYESEAPVRRPSTPTSRRSSTPPPRVNDDVIARCPTCGEGLTRKTKGVHELGCRGRRPKRRVSTPVATPRPTPAVRRPPEPSERACPVCGRVAPVPELLTHLKYAHGTDAARCKLPCPVCQKMVAALALEMHMRDAHGPGGPPRKKRKNNKRRKANSKRGKVWRSWD